MIQLKDAKKTYDNGTEAIRGVSFRIDDGEFVFLVGPSGSGKSTLIKMLTGEIVPTAGRVQINGFSMSRISDRQLPYMRRTIGVVFQDFRLIGSKTVYENLALAMRAVDASPREVRQRIPYVMDLVGLPLLGLVPEDASVVLAAASGRLLIDFTEQGAAKACHNLAGRLEGRRVPLMKLKK